MKINYLPYKLIGGAMNPKRPWFCTPFKGIKDDFLPEENHWNYIQSSIRMLVEQAFGCLKRRWRITLKWIDSPL